MSILLANARTPASAQRPGSGADAPVHDLACRSQTPARSVDCHHSPGWDRAVPPRGRSASAGLLHAAGGVPAGAGDHSTLPPVGSDRQANRGSRPAGHERSVYQPGAGTRSVLLPIGACHRLDVGCPRVRRGLSHLGRAAFVAGLPGRLLPGAARGALSQRRPGGTVDRRDNGHCALRAASSAPLRPVAARPLTPRRHALPLRYTNKGYP
jgi:hypothetical protein